MLRPRPSARPYGLLIGSFLLGVLLTYIWLSAPNSSAPEGWKRELESNLRSQKLMLSSQAAENFSEKKKLLAIVGVQTGFSRARTTSGYNYPKRREALRATWFPASQAEADRAEAETGILYRFVIGHSLDPRQEADVDREMQQNGACIRLPLVYVFERYDAEYIVKVDDDVYLRTDRLPHILSQWKLHGADYIGCMKTGQVFRDPHLRWFEPQNSLIGGKSYFTHAWGSIYVLSSHAASILATLSAAAPEGLRFFNNEDVTVGGWMLAMNVTHLDDRRLCERECGDATLAVYDIPECAGLCDAPQKLPELHRDPKCRTPILDSKGDIPTLRPFFYFQSVRPK